MLYSGFWLGLAWLVLVRLGLPKEKGKKKNNDIICLDDDDDDENDYDDDDNNTCIQYNTPFDHLMQ